MKSMFVGALVALVGAFIATQGSKMAGPILLAIGLSIILVAALR